jgi:hypothetical protein
MLVVAALLLAQQAALAHQYWHVSQAVAGVDAKKVPKADSLCKLHDLLGTVLGLAGGAAQASAFLALSEPGFTAATSIVREAALLSARSRDPPLIS